MGVLPSFSLIYSSQMGRWQSKQLAVRCNHNSFVPNGKVRIQRSADRRLNVHSTARPALMDSGFGTRTVPRRTLSGSFKQLYVDLRFGPDMTELRFLFFENANLPQKPVIFMREKHHSNSVVHAALKAAIATERPRNPQRCPPFVANSRLDDLQRTTQDSRSVAALTPIISEKAKRYVRGQHRHFSTHSQAMNRCVVKGRLGRKIAT
jgi:hypothetical protein